MSVATDSLVFRHLADNTEEESYPCLMCKLLIAFLLATSALAADEHDFIAKNFRFHDGETMAKPSDGLPSQVSPLRLRRHSTSARAPRIPRYPSSIYGDGHVDGRHAHMDVGRAMAGG